MEDSPYRTFAQAVLWPIATVLLIVGLVCWGLRAFLSPAETSVMALLLGILIWAGAAALCALALKVLSRANDFWRTLAAMWRPLALVLAGAFLLFFNDQGRELGVSLMIDNDGKLPFRLSVLGPDLLGSKQLALRTRRSGAKSGWRQAASDRLMAAKRCAQTPSRRGDQKSHRSLPSTTWRFGLSGVGCAGTTPRSPFSSAT